jgi:ribonuclease/clavin/mitogillin
VRGGTSTPGRGGPHGSERGVDAGPDLGQLPPGTRVALALIDAAGRCLLVDPPGAPESLGDEAPPSPSHGPTTLPGRPLDAAAAALAGRLWGRDGPEDAARAAVLAVLAEDAGLLLTSTELLAVPTASATELEDAAGATGRRPDASRLIDLGIWSDPPHAATPGATWLFVLPVPEAAVHAAPRRAARARRPGAVLADWAARRALLPPLELEVLRSLDVGLEGAARRLQNALSVAALGAPLVELVAGLRQLPLRTPTLPPARHTNAYLIGDERLWIVDPAPYDADEREVLLETALDLRRRGARIDGVVLTHHHRDHFGAASWLGDALAIPVRGHARTAELLAGQCAVRGDLDEGDVLDLGLDRTGLPFRLSLRFTPGHAPGHLVLVDERPELRAMVVGDMVAATGTIVIDPPEGDMARYLSELRRLAAESPDVLLAAHGLPIVGGVAKLEAYVAHRLGREARVDAALRRHRGAAAPEDLLPDAYEDTPLKLYPLAARSCLAHLEKLVTDGRAERRGARFVPRTG